MDPLKDFENSNARQWEQESVVGGSTQSPTSKSPSTRSHPNQTTPLGRSNPHSARTVKELSVGNANYRSPSRGLHQPQLDTQQIRRHTATAMPSSGPLPKPWVKPQGLVTTRQSSTAVEKEKAKAKIDKYLGSVEGEDYPATAYYLWPAKGTNPRELLGWKLEKLDILRKSYRVLIEWDDKKQCLTINSERATSNRDMMATIKGIRQAVQSSEAEVVYASPQYIVMPPTATIMRAIVQPRYDGKNIIGAELGGRQFSAQEQEVWRSSRGDMLDKNLTKFREHLMKHATLLAPLMGWMRMRVHFGHARLGKVREEFVHSKYSLEDFIKMMNLSRVRTSGKFDRKLDDATLATKMLQRIVASPDFFCPAQARIFSLEDVEPKHTGIIFVNIPDGENLRIEAEVDYTREDGLGQYQIGTTRLFRDDRRNKRVEVTTLDIESEFDWTLEIITDGSITDLPPSLLSLIDGSLSGNSKEQQDRLGFSYPRISPKFVYGLDVRIVVVRSVYQYLLRESGYIVEVAVYREWNGYNTSSEPKMLSSVSMFHPGWDDEMDSIENTTRERNWDSQLKCFFERKDQGGGIRKFMEDVLLIQGLLCDAARASKEDPSPIAGKDDHLGKD